MAEFWSSILFAALERCVESSLVVLGRGKEEAVAWFFENRSKREFTGPSSTLCMCACIALSHPRRSFEASQLEGNNSQRRQRHLWRPRNNSRPDVHLVCSSRLGSQINPAIRSWNKNSPVVSL